ncbi:prevent-host-death protein [Paramagnetospirillum kuznetsovii]|uniref:Antitoxin n=1 Tax=Paramagnetospirillum kuznetsovii TaxID=2053833 RepID=A0A364NVF9_9PROT|nr:type II toxin-antitoxin system Phd/YefM family antitoxin [Paramagnetospirillum kuznetsovii]RAU21046.1 prevent-host-death protein [Paramagnetospirillum kuznetsovii]
MTQPVWSIQDAKNHFSEVVEAARHGEPQTVTKHGKPTAVILSCEDYERLRRVEEETRPTFAQHLLAMPTDGGEFERSELRLRDVEF